MLEVKAVGACCHAAPSPCTATWAPSAAPWSAPALPAASVSWLPPLWMLPAPSRPLPAVPQLLLLPSWLLRGGGRDGQIIKTTAMPTQYQAIETQQSITISSTDALSTFTRVYFTTSAIPIARVLTMVGEGERERGRFIRWWPQVARLPR
mgnify:CR=1 FL=1